MATPSPQPITVDAYDRMIEDGLLTADDRVELIEGAIVEMSPIGVPHATCVNNLTRFFARRAPDDVIVGVQNPARVSELSQPQPDLLLFRAAVGRNPKHHPHSEETLLLVEVSDSTLVFDREVKAPLYSAAGVPELWIVDVEGERVVRFSRPAGRAWGSQEVFARGQSLAPFALPELVVAVDTILPNI